MPPWLNNKPKKYVKHCVEKAKLVQEIPVENVNADGEIFFAKNMTSKYVAYGRDVRKVEKVEKFEDILLLVYKKSTKASEFFFLYGFSFANIHDSLDSRGRKRVFL